MTVQVGAIAKAAVLTPEKAQRTAMNGITKRALRVTVAAIAIGVAGVVSGHDNAPLKRALRGMASGAAMMTIAELIVAEKRGEKDDVYVH